MSEPSPFTTHRRFGPGHVLRTGAVAPYRAVTVTAGEQHLLRDDLVDDGRPGPAPAAGRPLLVLAHVTDLQLADVQSPTRFEFLNREWGDPRYAGIVPVQRPQEALTAHAVDATLRTLNNLPGAPATGAPLQLAVTTGDAIDNAQWNETQVFLALFEGGTVRTRSGGPGYEGVQSLDWPDDIFWKPDGVRDEGPDFFRLNYGFPHRPGLLERALVDFEASGLQIPWLACFGNHEALNQGVGVATPGLLTALRGDRKPLRLPPGFDHERALDVFIEQPELFMTGPTSVVTADPDRRAISRREFVEAHFRTGSRPYGHGFEDRNRMDGTAHYVYDTPTCRLIALDTNCLAGGADGCLDNDQFQWLADRLAEVHSTYRGVGGDEVRTGNDDRLVILFSHHGIDTLTNTRAAHRGPDGTRLVGVAEIITMLHRFPNLVLWLNGHTHRNGVRARRDPTDRTRAFWEVTTCAIVDWPSQTRVVELVDRGDGVLAIICTMVDHDTPATATSLDSSDQLAALHRELAANVPWAGFESDKSGAQSDRNVELRITAPFALARLRSV